MVICHQEEEADLQVEEVPEDHQVWEAHQAWEDHQEEVAHHPVILELEAHQDHEDLLQAIQVAHQVEDHLRVLQAKIQVIYLELHRATLSEIEMIVDVIIISSLKD